MRNLMKRAAGVLVSVLALALFLGSFLSFTSRASGQEAMELKDMLQPTTAYESMSEDGAVAGNLKQGDIVVIKSQEGDWFEVMYMGKTVYVRGNADELFETHVDQKAADELAERAKNSKSWVESYLTQKNAIRSANIWRVVIVVLIVVVIGVIIFNSIHRQNKEKGAAGNAGDNK